MRRFILLLFTLVVALPFAHANRLISIDVPPLEGVDPAQRFGTPPGEAYLPARAIDHPRAPVYAVNPADADDLPLPYYQIAPNTYFFFGNIAEVDPHNRGFNGNAGFIVTRDGVVVIDALGTPYLGRRMIASIREVTDRPIRYLIVTHAHPDHYYGAAAFAELPGVSVISHAGTEGYLNSSTIEHSVGYRRVFLPQDMENFKAVLPDILLGGGHPAQLTLKLGGKTIHVIDTGRHHSHGDLIVHQEEDRILWISDLAFNGRVTYIGDGNVREILPMQEWARRHYPDLALMVPGHGAPQTPPFAMLDFTGNYLASLLDRMRTAFDGGKGLAEAVADAGLKPYEAAPLYEMNHRLNANHIYRVIEAESF